MPAAATAAVPDQAALDADAAEAAGVNAAEQVAAVAVYADAAAADAVIADAAAAREAGVSEVDSAAAAAGVCGQLDVPGLSGLAASVEQGTGTNTEGVAVLATTGASAQPEDAAASCLSLPAQLAELPEAPVAAEQRDTSIDRDTGAVLAGEAASAAAKAAELHPQGEILQQQQQQQQQQQSGKKAASVLGQQARQLILADLVGWFAEGQEQQRQQQLEALAAAVREQQQGSSSSNTTGGRKRGRGGVGAAEVGRREDASSLPAAGDVRCDAEQLQMSGVVHESDTAQAITGADEPSSKRPRLVIGVDGGLLNADGCLGAAAGKGMGAAAGKGMGAAAGGVCGGSAVLLQAPAVLPGLLCALEFLGVVV
jgi:hypothetical protein